MNLNEYLEQRIKILQSDGEIAARNARLPFDMAINELQILLKNLSIPVEDSPKVPSTTE